MTERKLFTVIRQHLYETYGKPLPRDLLRRARTEFESMRRHGFEEALHQLCRFGEALRRTDLAWSHGEGLENGSLVFFALGLTGVDPVRFGLGFSFDDCPEPRFVLHLKVRERERLATLLPEGLCPYFTRLVDPVADFFAAAQRRLGMKFLGFRIDAIPLDDPPTLALFRRGDTEDVWGCSSEASRQYLIRLEPQHFADLLMLPAWAGSMPPELWNQAKNRIHPCLEPTRGWLLFKEQVIDLMRDLGGLPAHETAALLFDASLDEINPEGGSTITRMDRLFQIFTRNGVDTGTAEELACWIGCFGPSTISRAAAVAEMLVSWRMAWIKVHHPEEFIRGWEEAIPVFTPAPVTSLVVGTRSGETSVDTPPSFQSSRAAEPLRSPGIAETAESLEAQGSPATGGSSQAQNSSTAPTSVTLALPGSERGVV